MSNKITWLTHEFTVYSQQGEWNNVAGIYIFAGVNQENRWTPYYVGQCDSFQNRIPSHEKWDTARSLGATHVHARTVSQQAERDQIEQELIQAYQPRLNAQFRH